MIRTRGLVRPAVGDTWTPRTDRAMGNRPRGSRYIVTIVDTPARRLELRCVDNDQYRWLSFATLRSFYEQLWVDPGRS